MMYSANSANGTITVLPGNHLPGIAGPDFVAELHTRIPGLPILVIADYDDAPGNYPDPCVRFLGRPALAEQIVSAASQMLAPDNHKVA